MSFFLYFVAVNIGIELEKSLNADYISTRRIYSPQGVFSSVSVVPGEKMNYDLIMLAGKLRQVEKLDQLQEVKDLAETFIRREKNYALLTLMAVAEEFGEKEITDTLDKLRTHLSKCSCDRAGKPPLV